MNFKDFSSKEKTLIRQNIPNDLVKLIVEIVANIKNGNVSLDSSAKESLKGYKKRMDSLLVAQNTLGKRRKIVQKGGFLGTLLTLLGTQLVTHLLGKL